LLCARCRKNEASFLYQKLVEGRVLESGLCASCHAEESPGVYIGDSPLASLFAYLGAPAQGKRRVRCEACGLSFSEFRKCGRLGCARCYDAFAGEMDEVLAQVHACSRHSGKCLPPRDPKELARAIEKAVAAESFEEAARLRDRLKRIEGD